MRPSWLFAVFFWLWAFAPAHGAPVEGFVQREGNRLMLEGQSYYVSGANQYYLFYKSQAMTDDVLESAAALGLNTLRTWAFCNGEWHDGHCLQPSPGVYHEETFRNLDYAIYRAESLGIRLVFSLVNNWDAFGGMNTYVKWSKTAREHDDFYTDAETRALYKNYVTYVLNRRNTFTGRAYKDEPAILMWELANEPRIAKGRLADLYAWVDEMAAHIKSIDARHLVSTGSEGDYDTDLVQTHQSPHVDVVSFHLYPEDWNLSPEAAVDYIRRQIVTAKEELRKPVICGEFGLRDKSQRDRVYRSWYQAFQTHAIDGALFWLLSGRRDDGTLYPDYDGFTIYHPQSASTTSIIRAHADWAQARSGLTLDRTPPEVALDGWTDGDEVAGIVELSGRVADDQQVKFVVVNFGGADRPALVEKGGWRLAWDSRESLDGPVAIRITASDREGNLTHQAVRLKVANQGYAPGAWRLTGQKEQDDGYNYVYLLAATNESGRAEQGRFVARFYLRPEGTLRIGAHYENSQVYRGNPTVSELRRHFGAVHYLEIDLGIRTVGPGEMIGFKGQLNQADGGLKTGNDWSAGDLPRQPGLIEKVLWLKDGQVIGGRAP